MHRTFLLTLAVLLLLPSISFAQALGEGNGNEPFTVSVSPNYLIPHGKATLSFLSYNFDLAASTMIILVSGKKIYSGNVQSVSVSLGGVGEVLPVTIQITNSGTTYSKTINLQAEEVSLIAEPQSSSRALYPGKTLVPIEGNTRVVAIANFKNAKGVTLDPTKLSYSWMVDLTRISASSGIGRSALLVASPLQYRTRDVSVVVRDTLGTLVGGASLTLSPSEPTARVYENDPLLGIRFNHALTGSFTINGTESSLFATAYSLPLFGGTPSFQWFLNSDPAQTGPNITLRPTGTGQGTASASLTASGSSGDEAVASLSLIFGAKEHTNIFGL